MQKAFASAAFDPRKPGPLSTIVEVNDQTYLMKRAQEMLRDAERFGGMQRWTKLRDAVGILGYAMTIGDVQAEDLLPSHPDFRTNLTDRVAPNEANSRDTD